MPGALTISLNIARASVLGEKLSLDRDAMASPHASSFICLPFSDHSDMVTAYTVYFGVCIGSALIGVFGAAIFLAQVIRAANDGYPGKATSQRWILIMLALSDLFADLGKPCHNNASDSNLKNWRS